MAASSIAEYLIGIGFKIDEIGQKRFGESLITTSANFLKLGKTALDAAEAVGIATEAIASNYENLYYLSQRTGSTIQNLQATAFGFSQVGLQANDAKGMVDALALSLKFNPGTGVLFRAITGRNPSGDANADVMAELFGLRNMNPILQKGFGGEMGITPFQLSMLLAPGALEKIQAAGAALTAQQQAAGVNPTQMGKDSVELENSLRKLGAELGVLSDKIVGPLIVPLTHIADDTTKIVAWFAGLSFSKGQTVWDRVRDRGAGGGGVAGAGADIGHALGAALSGRASPFGDLSGISFGAGGGGTSAGQALREAFIRQRARVYGIDPDVAVRVARSEGLNNLADSQGGLGDHGTSGGDFQLHIGGGLGDAFRSYTGLDPLDPRNWQAADDFALRQAAQGGWRPWHGAARVGIGAYEGIGASAPLGSDGARGGGDNNYHIAPNITMNVTGGADPQTTADYVLKGQSGVWDDVFRNAGTTVR